MSGILQKLGILADEVETPESAPKAPESRSVHPPAPAAASTQARPLDLLPQAGTPVNVPHLPAFQTGDGSNEAKVVERLTKALDEANLPGLDFFEFQKALKNASKTLPGADEATRYSVAFGTLAAVGDVTPDAITSTADHYIQVLDDKQASFTQYIEAQLKEKVTAKQKETEDIRARILAKNEQIKALSEEIVKLTQATVESQHAAAQAKAELESYAQSFCDIKERFVSEIQQAKQKFITYIMPGSTGR